MKQMESIRKEKGEWSMLQQYYLYYGVHQPYSYITIIVVSVQQVICCRRLHMHLL